MLESYTALECLDIKRGGISPDAYFAALDSVFASIDDNKTKQLVSFAKKNRSLAVLDESMSKRDWIGELD